MRTNGQNGYYVFPVSERIAYVIRDNDVWRHHSRADCSAVRYDVFVLQGDHPTPECFKASIYISSHRHYVKACETVEHVCAAAVKLQYDIRERTRSGHE